MTGVLRLLATARWAGWTVLAAVIVAGCLGMAYWQLVRAESATGSLLNAGYALQWPLFGVFFGVLWWRMLRAEARALDEVLETEVPEPEVLEPEGLDAPRAPSPFTPRPAGVAAGGRDAVRPGSARAEYNAMLADLARGDDGRTT